MFSWMMKFTLSQDEMTSHNFLSASTSSSSSFSESSEIKVKSTGVTTAVVPPSTVFSVPSTTTTADMGRKGQFPAVTNNGASAAASSSLLTNSRMSIDIDVCADDGDRYEDDVFYMESIDGDNSDTYAFTNGKLTEEQEHQQHLHHLNQQSQASINCVSDLNAQLTRLTSGSINNNSQTSNTTSVFNSPSMCTNFSLISNSESASSQPLNCYDDTFSDSSILCQESSRQASLSSYAFSPGSTEEDESINCNSNSLTELHSKAAVSPPPSPLSMCLLIRGQPQSPTARILRRRCLFARKKKKQRHHRSPSPKSVQISPTYSTFTDEELTDTDTDSELLPVIARETLVNMTQEKMRSYSTDVHANSNGLRNRVLIESAFKKFLVSDVTLTPKKRSNDTSPTGASSVPSSPRKRSISSSSCSDLPSLSDSNTSSQITFAFASSDYTHSPSDSLSDSIKRIRLIHSESDVESSPNNGSSNGIKQSQSLSCSMNNLASVFCQVHRITDAAQEDPQFMVNPPASWDAAQWATRERDAWVY